MSRGGVCMCGDTECPSCGRAQGTFGRTELLESDDNALVFTLPEALREIRALREQKRVMVDTLKHISRSIGGTIGEQAAGALIKVSAICEDNPNEGP